jgi:hypothetical protein
MTNWFCKNSSCGGKHGVRFRVAGMVAVLAAVAGIAALAGMPSLSAQEHKPAAKSATAGADHASEVARGKYLVESVAMCGQCHSPRDESGEIDRRKWLEGASLPFTSAQEQSNWPLVAPRIGGLPPAGDADMIKLLTTGIWTNGKPLRFPMMPFRLSEADARAVVAYLKAPNAWK